MVLPHLLSQNVFLICWFDLLEHSLEYEGMLKEQDIRSMFYKYVLQVRSTSMFYKIDGLPLSPAISLMDGIRGDRQEGRWDGFPR